MKKPKILFLVTEDWYFWSHRVSIARAALARGYEVLIATRVNQHQARIEKEGFKLIPLKLERRGKNPFQELVSIYEILRIYFKEKPDIVHHVAVKPVLYGSVAAKIAGVPFVVNALAGLGYIFVNRGWKAVVIRQFFIWAYKIAFVSAYTVGIFQNSEDRDFFVTAGIVSLKKTVLIRGSGVDLTSFHTSPESVGSLTVILASRMLWDKGVGELIEAARKLNRQIDNFKIALVGQPDNENPNSIPVETLKGWHDEGVVEWWGYKNDMPKILAKANIVVLPTTYGEGVPKVLIEAAACGRAVVATDVPGCREIVRHNENGLLITPHDPEALADAIKMLIKSPELRAKMGARGREIVEAEFSEEIVVEQTLNLYKRLVSQQMAADV